MDALYLSWGSNSEQVMRVCIRSPRWRVHNSTYQPVRFSQSWICLPAFHTTVGDQESPDEMIHLATAVQFAGFRSVIGTMWAMDDSHTNKVISMFHELMMDEKGRLGYISVQRRRCE